MTETKSRTAPRVAMSFFTGDSDQFFNSILRTCPFNQPEPSLSGEPHALRAFTLPTDADGNAVTARFAQGVPTLEIARTAKSSSKIKQVEIRAAQVDGALPAPSHLQALAADRGQGST